MPIANGSITRIKFSETLWSVKRLIERPIGITINNGRTIQAKIFYPLAILNVPVIILIQLNKFFIRTCPVILLYVSIKVSLLSAANLKLTAY